MFDEQQPSTMHQQTSFPLQHQQQQLHSADSSSLMTTAFEPSPTDTPSRFPADASSALSEQQTFDDWEDGEIRDEGPASTDPSDWSLHQSSDDDDLHHQHPHKIDTSGLLKLNYVRRSLASPPQTIAQPLSVNVPQPPTATEPVCRAPTPPADPEDLHDLFNDYDDLVHDGLSPVDQMLEHASQGGRQIAGLISSPPPPPVPKIVIEVTEADDDELVPSGPNDAVALKIIEQITSHVVSQLGSTSPGPLRAENGRAHTRKFEPPSSQTTRRPRNSSSSKENEEEEDAEEENRAMKNLANRSVVSRAKEEKAISIKQPDLLSRRPTSLELAAAINMDEMADIEAAVKEGLQAEINQCLAMATMDMRIKTKAARKSFQESVPSASTSLKTSKPVLVKPTRKRAQESKIVTVDTSKMGDAAEEIADQPQITRNLKEFDMFAAKDDLSKIKHAAQQKEKVGSEENTIQTVQELSEQMSSPMEKDPSESVINCKDKPSTNKRNETSNHREISDPSPSCVQLQTQQSVDKLNNAKARKPQKRRNSYGKPRKRQQAKKSKTAVFGVSEQAGETWEINMHPATPQSKLSYSQVQGQISFTRMSEQGKVEPKRDPNKLPTTILSTPSSSIYTHPTASFHFGEESFTGFTPSDSELDDREMPASLKITLKRSRPSQAEPAENLRDTATTYVSETGRPLRRCRQRSLGYVEQSEVVDQEVPSEPFSAEINVAQPDNMLSPNAVLPESNGLVSIIKTVGNSTHETGEPEISNTVQSENLEASNQALGLIGEQQPWAEEMKENSTDVNGKALETSKETPEEILGLYESGTAGSPVKAVECEAQNSGLTSVAEQVSLTQGECLPEQIVALMELESAGCEVCLGDSTTDELEEQELKLVHRGVNTETVGSTDQTKACQELEDREDHHVESAQIHDPVSAAESSKISEATEKFEVEKLPPEIDESHQSNKTPDLCKEDKAETDVTNAQVMDGEFYLEPKQVETPEQAPVEVFGDKADVEEHSNEEQRDLYDKVDHNDNTTNEKSITTETDIDTKLEENKKVEMKQKRKLQARKSIVKDNESMCPKATVMLKRKLIERTIKAQESLMSFRSKRAKQLKMMAEMYGMAKMTKANQVESPQEQVVEPRNINEIQSQGEDAEKKTDALKQTDGHKQDAGTPTESELVSLKAETKLPAADAPTLETWTEEAIRLGLFQPDESLGRMHKFYQLKEDPDEEGIDLASTDGDLEVNKKRSPEEESVNVHQKYIGVLERSLKQQRKQIAATRKTLKEQMQISETLISKYRGAVDFLVEKLLHEQLVLPVSSTPIDAIIEASKKRLIRKIQAS